MKLKWYAEQRFNPSDYTIFDNLYNQLQQRFPAYLDDLSIFKQKPLYQQLIAFLYRFNRTELCSYERGNTGVISQGFSVKSDFIEYMQQDDLHVTNTKGETIKAKALYEQMVHDMGEDFLVVFAGESDFEIPQEMTDGVFSMIQDDIDRNEVSVVLTATTALKVAHMLDEELSIAFESTWKDERHYIRDAFIREIVKGYRIRAYTCLEGYRPIIFSKPDDLGSFFECFKNEQLWKAELKKPIKQTISNEERFDVDFEAVDLKWAFGFLATKCTLAYEGVVITPFDTIGLISGEDQSTRIYDFKLNNVPLSFDIVYPLDERIEDFEDEIEESLDDYLAMRPDN